MNTGMHTGMHLSSSTEYKPSVISVSTYLIQTYANQFDYLAIPKSIFVIVQAISVIEITPDHHNIFINYKLFSNIGNTEKQANTCQHIGTTHKVF